MELVLFFYVKRHVPLAVGKHKENKQKPDDAFVYCVTSELNDGKITRTASKSQNAEETRKKLFG